jgi:hypothetical protein
MICGQDVIESQVGSVAEMEQMRDENPSLFRIRYVPGANDLTDAEEKSEKYVSKQFSSEYLLSLVQNFGWKVGNKEWRDWIKDRERRINVVAGFLTLKKRGVYDYEDCQTHEDYYDSRSYFDLE